MFLAVPMNKSDLTIILPLKGRPLHTLRWLWHADRIGFPYHIIIADGEVYPVIDSLLSDSDTFKNLSFEYHRYSDLTFKDFYRKCVDAAQKVRTSYVMIADNDDFPILTGIQQSISYLDSNPEYVCAGGKVPDFYIDSRSELSANVIGQLVGPRFGYTYPCFDNSNKPLSERVMDNITDSQLSYYHVYRTQALQTIFEEVEKHDFSELSVHELYIALRTITLGKVRADPSIICYLRQRGTSLNTYHKHDWVYHLLHSQLPQDYRVMANSIAKEMERQSGTNADAFRETILDAYAENIRHMLGHTMLRHRFPRLFKIKQKLIRLKDFQFIPVWYQRRKAEKKFWQVFSNDALDESSIESYKNEFGSIESSLQGDEFLFFIKTNAPDLLKCDLE